MIMLGLKFTAQPPFHTVYLHGTVRDAQGQRMSKTKGNVLDPTLISAEYGTDALRFALVTASGPGNDLKMSNDRVEASRNFANKLYNATRFALNAIGKVDVNVDADGSPLLPGEDNLSLVDRWIVTRLNQTIDAVTRLTDDFQFHEAGRTLYEFIWSEFCDWYIEAAKVRLRDERIDPAVPLVLAFVLERTLRLLHPAMPFVTEELWQQLPHAGPGLIVAAWPESGVRFEQDADSFEAVKEAVRCIRNARSEHNVEPGRRIGASIYAGELRSVFEAVRPEIEFLARLDPAEVEFRDERSTAPDDSIAVVTDSVAIYLPLAGLINVEAERERIRVDIASAQVEVERATSMLANEQFVERAPAAVVDAHRARLAAASERVALLRTRLDEL
jgi:valyl-tRNA synthetase